MGHESKKVEDHTSVIFVVYDNVIMMYTGTFFGISKNVFYIFFTKPGPNKWPTGWHARGETEESGDPGLKLCDTTASHWN